METYGIKTNAGLKLGEHRNFIGAKKIALKWLENNIGRVSVSNRVTFAIDTFESPIITKDNIHLYYEFMSDEDKKLNKVILRNSIHKRKLLVLKSLNLVLSYDDEKKCNFKYIDIQSKYLGYSIFGVKDTLKPINEYIAEIKESSEYKEYISFKIISELVDYLIDFGDIDKVYYIDRIKKIKVSDIQNYYFKYSNFLLARSNKTNMIDEVYRLMCNID